MDCPRTDFLRKKHKPNKTKALNAQNK